MPQRVLLLCFVHGFKGSDDTFHEFPQNLKQAVAQLLPNDQIESVIYPKYETKGELAEAAASFLEWLKECVLDARKKYCETPWPPNDDTIGVVLVAHSMGGFVAADALFLALDDRSTDIDSQRPLFPLIKGMLAFDTPYNGLARSMFVYGAFSNYSKVSTVFNAMTALSAAAPAGLARLSGARGAVTSSVAKASRSPRWAMWQLLAIRTGTVGAIAAGGVAAYVHREAIMRGLQSVRNVSTQTIAEGYRQSVESVGQGLAYINRDSIGQSFAWLSDHFTFVGALMKPKELGRRLDRLGGIKGIGIHDSYCSLGPNGYWRGGYFVPERTFCAIPDKDHDAYQLFSRRIMAKFDDETKAHLNIFQPASHEGYDDMVDSSADLVKTWFLSCEPIVDDRKFNAKDPEVVEEGEAVERVLSQEEDGHGNDGYVPASNIDLEEARLSDESPIDIAAVASLFADNGGENDGEVTKVDGTDEASTADQRTYLQYLVGVAQRAGMGAKDLWPQTASHLPSVSLTQLSEIPSSVSSRMPNMALFSRRKRADVQETAQVEPLAKRAKVEDDGTDNAQVDAVGPENKHDASVDALKTLAGAKDGTATNTSTSASS